MKKIKLKERKKEEKAKGNSFVIIATEHEARKQVMYLEVNNQASHEAFGQL